MFKQEESVLVDYTINIVSDQYTESEGADFQGGISV